MGASGLVSVSAPPGERGGGRLTKLFLPPQAPHRFKPMPHGLPCSLNPLPRELPRCAVVGAWFQPFFTYTNTYSGFPAAGCSDLGQQVPRGPQSLRVWVWGVAVPKQKLTDPSTLPEKDQFLVGVWVETETSQHGVDPLPLSKKGGRGGGKGGSPVVAATLWWEGRGPGNWELHTCVLASTGGQRTHPSFARKSFRLSPGIPQMGNGPGKLPLAHGQAPRGCVTAAKRRGWLPRRWCGHVAKDGSVTYKLVYTHGERKGGGGVWQYIARVPW